ncbi:MAG: polysaccharide biosynthesis/export family protein [Bacteroidota bacterium]
MRTMNGLKRIEKQVLLVLMAVLLLGSCVNHRSATLIKEADRKTNLFDIENPRETSYQIQTGDQLYIKVYSLDPQTSRFFQSDLPNLMNDTYVYLNSFTVDQDGFISFSFVEKLYIQGLTIEEAQIRVQEVLNEYFNEITVVVKLINFQISVMGEVKSPGTVTLNREYANILQAISHAGGTTEFANLERIKLIRQTTTGSEVIIVDMGDLDLLSQEYYHLMPNDILYLEPRPIKTWGLGNFPWLLPFSVAATALSIYNLLQN